MAYHRRRHAAIACLWCADMRQGMRSDAEKRAGASGPGRYS